MINGVHSYLLIFLSGGLGSLSRFIVSQKLLPYQLLSYPFPVATLAVNSIGGFLAGLLIGSLGREHGIAPFLLAGFLGGFTTFSAFSLEVVEAIKESKYSFALIIILANVLLAVSLCFLGYSLTKNVAS